MITQKIQFINDILVFIDFILILLTASILKFTLSSGTDMSEFLYIYKHEWISINYWLIIILGVLLLIHLILNWKWMVTMFKFFRTTKED